MPVNLSDDLITLHGGDGYRYTFNSMPSAVRTLRKIAKPGDVVSVFLPPDTHSGLVYRGGMASPTGKKHRLDLRDHASLVMIFLCELARQATAKEPK